MISFSRPKPHWQISFILSTQIKPLNTATRPAGLPCIYFSAFTLCCLSLPRPSLVCHIVCLIPEPLHKQFSLPRIPFALCFRSQLLLPLTFQIRSNPLIRRSFDTKNLSSSCYHSCHLYLFVKFGHHLSFCFEGGPMHCLAHHLIPQEGHIVGPQWLFVE